MENQPQYIYIYIYIYLLGLVLYVGKHTSSLLGVCIFTFCHQGTSKAGQAASSWQQWKWSASTTCCQKFKGELSMYNFTLEKSLIGMDSAIFSAEASTPISSTHGATNSQERAKSTTCLCHLYPYVYLLTRCVSYNRQSRRRCKKSMQTKMRKKGGCAWRFSLWVVL